MGLEIPPAYPAPRDSSDNGERSIRHPSIELALRELCDLQAQATRLAVTIQALVMPQPSSSPHSGRGDEQLVRGILKARLDRGRFFAPDLFADPAWDMLLALYAAELAQQRMPVASLCIASNVPTTTALRWISHLEREELVERRPDLLDARRFFISLTKRAGEAMAQYFAGTMCVAEAA